MESRDAGGVFPADPSAPPTPPPDAVGIEILNDRGQVIAWGWVVSDIAGPTLTAAAWTLYEAERAKSHEPPTGPHLMTD